MHNLPIDENIQEKVQKLYEKFSADGQDLNTQLDGLLFSKYVSYWDYIRLDSLLTLQTPRTDYPDEMIFIVYHQITELYFKMVLHELEQLKQKEAIDAEFFSKRLKRVHWYFGQLINSFDIVSVGLDQDQFLKFRAALSPASGFQSVQYRMVEVASTDFINLVEKDHRDSYSDYSTIEEMYENTYWQKGAIDVKTGKTTLTLRMFEQQYGSMLQKMANEYKFKNLWSIFKRLPSDVQNDPELLTSMRQYDQMVNINWPLAHYKYAVSYLISKSKGAADATGGTNWRQYLPPRFQKVIFFPGLWSEEEMQNWGKSWVETEVLSKMPANI
jgi:tryptophan 2,3-dioxygenase